MSLARSPGIGSVSGTTLGAISDSYTYDGFGELTAYSASAGSTMLYAYTNTFDADGRVVARTESIGGTSMNYTYQYDVAGRLVGVARNGSAVSEYRYDANSNRILGKTASGVARGRYDRQDRMTAYGHAHYRYTSDGQLIRRSEGQR